MTIVHCFYRILNNKMQKVLPLKNFFSFGGLQPIYESITHTHHLSSSFSFGIYQTTPLTRKNARLSVVALCVSFPGASGTIEIAV